MGELTKKFWFQNAGVPVEAAQIAVDKGITGVVFRCCHPTDKRHKPALDIAVAFKAKNPAVEVVVQQDLWDPTETRVDFLVNPQVFLDNLAYPKISLPGIRTAIDCELYMPPLKALGLLKVPAAVSDLIVMKAAVRRVEPFDYVTPAMICPLLYGNQPYSSMAEIFPGLGIRGMDQHFHYKTITAPAKWLGADRTNIVSLAVTPGGDERRYSPKEAMAAYPDRDRMLVPESNPIECSKNL